MGQAGHRIIVADQDWKNRFNLTRFSKYVSKFVLLPSNMPYEDALLKVWEDEKIDCFLPVSHIHLAIEDTKAKIKMQAKANKFNKKFVDLALNDVEMVKKLDDKDEFLKRCQELGLKVPDFKTFFGQDLVVELGEIRNEGMKNHKLCF